MTKSSGLGDNLYAGGYDLSGDIQALGNIGGGPAALDFTGIDKSAMERQGGVRDGRMQATSFFNPDTDRAHPRLGALPRADVILSYFRGTALGGASANLNAKQVNYDGTRGDDGSFTFAVEGLGSGYGLEWGTNLTPGLRTDTAATNGPSVDFGAAPADFGLQAYLHVFAFTGTSVTVTLQQSSDDGAGDAWADVAGGAFVAATGPGAQRIETARDLAVERYLRVVTAGTFSEAVIAVSVIRNEVETRF